MIQYGSMMSMPVFTEEAQRGYDITLRHTASRCRSMYAEPSDFQCPSFHIKLTDRETLVRHSRLPLSLCFCLVLVYG